MKWRVGGGKGSALPDVSRNRSFRADGIPFEPMSDEEVIQGRYEAKILVMQQFIFGGPQAGKARLGPFGLLLNI